MSFWSQQEPFNPEPLRQYRWYMYFNKSVDEFNPNVKETAGLQEFIFALKECGKPEYKIETSQHVLINHTFNYPKNLVWQPINVKMVSAVTQTNSLALALNSVINQSGYIIPKEPQNTQLSKKLASFTSIQIIQIDAGDFVVQEDKSIVFKTNEIDIWTLRNAFITNVKFGNLSYSSDDFVDVDFTITYDYAEYKSNPDVITESGPVGVVASAARALQYNGTLEVENIPPPRINQFGI